MAQRIVRSEDEWCARLTPEKHRVIREKGTERAFTEAHHATAAPGVYRCVGCGQPLFAPLHDDPRWLPFLRKIGRDPEQLAAIPFDVRLPGAPGTATAVPGSGR